MAPSKQSKATTKRNREGQQRHGNTTATTREHQQHNNSNDTTNKTHSNNTSHPNNANKQQRRRLRELWRANNGEQTEYNPMDLLRHKANERHQTHVVTFCKDQEYTLPTVAPEECERPPNVRRIPIRDRRPTVVEVVRRVVVSAC